MAIKLQKITSKPFHDFIEVETDASTEKVSFIYVGYSPAISREAEEAVEAAEAKGEKTNATVETLFRVLTHIDLLGDDDQPIAITKENLARVPFHYLNAIIRKIMEAANPKKTS